MLALSLAFIALVASFLVWLLIYCLRMGVVGSRNGPDAHRDTQPIRFWTGIAALAFGASSLIGGFIYVVWMLVAPLAG